MVADLAGRFDAEAVFAAAAHGDPTAVQVVHTIAARFARGLAPVLLVLDPDLVVIGAGLSRAGDALLEEIEACVLPLALVPPKLGLSRLGDEAVTLGAVELALADAQRRAAARPRLALGIGRAPSRRTCGERGSRSPGPAAQNTRCKR